jgi:hypothetical protein
MKRIVSTLALGAALGVGSRLGTERGLNALWNKGGLQYAPPIR